MNQMLMTLGADFIEARSVNATDTSFPSRIPTVTEPVLDAGTATGQATIDLLARNGPKDAPVQNSALFVFFGTGNEDTTFSARVIGWRRLKGNPYHTSSPTKDLWVPVVLAEFGCTLSATVGVAATPVVAADRFVDTITLVTGNEDVSVDFVSPTGDEIAHALVDVKGFQKLEVTFDMTGATDGNALVALL